MQFAISLVLWVVSTLWPGYHQSSREFENYFLRLDIDSGNSFPRVPASIKSVAARDAARALLARKKVRHVDRYLAGCVLALSMNRNERKAGYAAIALEIAQSSNSKVDYRSNFGDLMGLLWHETKDSLAISTLLAAKLDGASSEAAAEVEGWIFATSPVSFASCFWRLGSAERMKTVGDLALAVDDDAAALASVKFPDDVRVRRLLRLVYKEITSERGR